MCLVETMIMAQRKQRML